MSPVTWFAVIGAGVVVFFLYRAFKTPLDKVVDAAVEKQDTGLILDAINELRERARPAGYNRAIRRLWDKYHRPLAVELIKELAINHTDVPIAQYWLKQVMTVEPTLAKKKLNKKFLRAHYQPEIAAKCYHVG